MKMIRNGIRKGTAVLLALVLCQGCGASRNAVDQNEISPIREKVTEKPIAATESPTPVPTQMPTEVPLSAMIYCRPSYSNVAVGSASYSDERGSFTIVNNSLTAVLPVNDADGYSWRCIDHNAEGIFSVSEGELQNYPYAYTSGKYGGEETPKSKVREAEDRWKKMKAEAEEARKALTITPAPEDEVFEEHTDYYEYETQPEPEPEPSEEEPAAVPDDPLDGWNLEFGDGNQDDGWEEGAEGDFNNEQGGYGEDVTYEYTSFVMPKTALSMPDTKIQKCSVSAAEKKEDVTYVYASAREQFTFTPVSPGTNIFYLEYVKGKGVEQELDSGFVLFAHVDDSLAVTFDLVHYSFATCVAAPNEIAESEAEIVRDEVASQENDAEKAFDSCVRRNNTIGASAVRVEGGYWEVYSTDNDVASVVSNGGALYHEDYQDYTWDMFSINPNAPGRTTLYFYYRNGDGQPIPRMQVADVKVAEDLSLTVHVRRFDIGVEFD